MMRLLRRWKYLPNVLRLAAFCLVVTFGLLALSARAVARNVNEGMMSLGREMMLYTDRRALGEVRTLEINGARLEFATGVTDDGVRQVLDVYERRCATRDGALSAQLAEVVAAARPAGAQDGVARPAGAQGAAPAPADGRRAMTTMRGGDERSGFVACLDVGTARLPPGVLLQRVQAFVASGNIADVGRMRYLYAERAQSGRTRLIGFWSDGEVNVRRMFPTTGDAPGDDMPRVARAPGFRRLLSARESGEQYAMAIYAGNGERAAAEAFYQREMPRAGWTAVPMRGGNPDLGGQAMQHWERGAATATLVFDQAGAQTTVTVLSGM